jgi:tungstate transport system permease protein
MALNDFMGRRLVIAQLSTGMSLPPVVVGLFVTVLLGRDGPLRFLGILYTLSSLFLAQAVVTTPILARLRLATLQHLPPGLRL